MAVIITTSDLLATNKVHSCIHLMAVISNRLLCECARFELGKLHVFHPQLSYTKYNTLGLCCFSTKNAEVGSKIKTGCIGIETMCQTEATCIAVLFVKLGLSH